MKNGENKLINNKKKRINKIKLKLLDEFIYIYVYVYISGGLEFI